MNFVNLTLGGENLPDQFPLPVGSIAPYFSGIDQNGNAHSLESIKSNGPVVVIFYRGFWCFHCLKHLKRFQKDIESLKEKNINVVVITSEGEEFRNKTIQKTKVEIPIIIDFNHNIMKSYNVVTKVSPFQEVVYEKVLGAKLKHDTEIDNKILPIPATYIIKENGVIDYVHFDPNYKKRASVQDILEHLKL